MDSKVVLICNEGPSPESIQRWINTLKHYEDLGPDPIEDGCVDVASGDCQNDHGERTNYKLRDQPFYMRGRNGKMRGY
jgi:hypothetical protein